MAWPGGWELLWRDRLCFRDAKSWLISESSLLPSVTSGFPLTAADSMVSPGSHKTLDRDSSRLVSFSGGWSLCTKKSLSSAVKWVTRAFLSPAHIAAGAPGCVVCAEEAVSHGCSRLCWGKISTYQCNWERAGLGWGAERSCRGARPCLWEFSNGQTDVDGPDSSPSM